MSFRAHHGDSFNDRVEALALPALHAQKVPASILLHPLAIVALHGDDLGKIRRYRLQRNALGHCVPRGFHPFVRLGRLFAHGTPAVVARELTEAVPVYCVTAGQFVTGVAR